MGRKRLLVCAIMLMAGILTSVTAAQPQQEPNGVIYEYTPLLSIADRVQATKPAVVHVANLTDRCQGSGCLISPDGLMFTAKHVSDGQTCEYVVTLNDGRTFPVKYAVEDRDNDITFMQLDLTKGGYDPNILSHEDFRRLQIPPGHYYVQEPNLPYAKLATESLQTGDFAFILGSSLGYDNFNTVSLGIVSATGRDLYNRSGWERYRQYTWHGMIQTTSPAYPGNSGGPVFNMKGEVIGVLVAGQDATLNFAVPVARFVDTIETVRMCLRASRFHILDPENPPSSVDFFTDEFASTLADSISESVMKALAEYYNQNGRSSGGL